MYSIYNMAQTGKSTHTKIAKPHIHVMMTQMSVNNSAIKATMH